jgi:hypothetical protein
MDPAFACGLVAALEVSRCASDPGGGPGGGLPGGRAEEPSEVHVYAMFQLGAYTGTDPLPTLSRLTDDPRARLEMAGAPANECRWGSRSAILHCREAWAAAKPDAPAGRGLGVWGSSAAAQECACEAVQRGKWVVVGEPLPWKWRMASSGCCACSLERMPDRQSSMI